MREDDGGELLGGWEEAGVMSSSVPWRVAAARTEKTGSQILIMRASLFSSDPLAVPRMTGSVSRLLSRVVHAAR